MQISKYVKRQAPLFTVFVICILLGPVQAYGNKRHDTGMTYYVDTDQNVFAPDKYGSLNLIPYSTDMPLIEGYVADNRLIPSSSKDGIVPISE